MSGSCCDCEFFDFTWSRSTSQESFCVFDGREEPANFDMDLLAFRTNDGNCFPGGAFENPGLEIDDMIQCPRCGPQQPCAASTPRNNDHAEKWESPGVTPPPYSSSPVCLTADFSPFLTDPALPMSRREDAIEGRLLFCRPRDSDELRIKAPFNDRVPTTPLMNRFPSRQPTSKLQIHQVSFAQTDMGVGFSVAQGSLDEHLRAISERRVVADDIPANVQDICTMRTRTAIDQTNDVGNPDEIHPVSARGSPVPTSRKGVTSSGPTDLDLALSIELESTLSHGTGNDRLHDATTTSGSRLKRRRSSVDCPRESKKVKLDRVVSHVSCASESSVEFKYQATEPASIRRAQSLRSEISACSEESTVRSWSPCLQNITHQCAYMHLFQDSLFYPSPLSPPTCRPCPDENYPPTVPSTPLPNSVDYARSKANPLVRTVAAHRRRSLNISTIPPVPVIAPPTHITPTFIRCTEDQAIDRLHALLLRESSERERDGLHVHDAKRTERWKAAYGTDLAYSRRDSASTSDSSDGRGQWDEESTRSGTESQESQDSVPNVKILPGQHRLVNQETWSNAFGITNDFRKDVTKWILEVGSNVQVDRGVVMQTSLWPEELPKEPIPCVKPSRDECRLGINLYDQLTNSRQTRYHAAQLFHRYFLLPDKVRFWRALCKYECFEQESRGLHDDFDWERSVWDLAVACVALSVKVYTGLFIFRLEH